MLNLDLDGKVGIITGATGGLGAPIAKTLAEQGVTTVLVGRRADALDAVAKKIGKRALAWSCDVTNESDIAKLVSGIEKKFGRVDILVNCAGINIRKSAVDLSSDDWRAVMETNLTGPFLLSKAVLPGMLKQRFGRIVNIASIFSFVTWERRAAYSASKGGLLQLTKTLALEVVTQGVTVNAICPGVFKTPMNEQLLRDAAHQDFLKSIPMRRMGEPEELSGLVAYLCAPQAAYITGAAFIVDGGWTAR
ncbi:MAG: SDR family oxidoreductase [Candidatus Omnitrophica bacterium]|nr:SDR family oxidoreductase [Candidatus Omnitrophota bacterium]